MILILFRLLIFITTKIKVNLQARLIMKVFQPIELPVRIDISECNLGQLLYIIKVIEKKDRTRNIFIKFFRHHNE